MKLKHLVWLSAFFVLAGCSSDAGTESEEMSSAVVVSEESQIESSVATEESRGTGGNVASDETINDTEG